MLNRNIVLIGMPGSGKSTVGELLARQLNVNFLDLDAFIEKIEGMTIKDMFAKGEDFFRIAESKCLKEAINLKGRKIIAAGGGIVKREENYSILKNKSIIIFINRPVDKIAGDVDIKSRPLLADGVQKLYALYNERFPIYKKWCDYEIDNRVSPEAAVQGIIDIVG